MNGKNERTKRDRTTMFTCLIHILQVVYYSFIKSYENLWRQSNSCTGCRWSEPSCEYSGHLSGFWDLTTQCGTNTQSTDVPSLPHPPTSRIAWWWLPKSDYILSMGITKNTRGPKFFFLQYFFSDEATFTNHDSVNRHNMHYWSANNPYWLREVDHQRPWSINVRCGIMGVYLIGPYFIKRTLTVVKYRDFLQNDLGLGYDTGGGRRAVTWAPLERRGWLLWKRQFAYRSTLCLPVFKWNI